MSNHRKKIVFAFIVVFLLSAFYFLFSAPMEAAETLKYEFPCTTIGGKDCPPPGETATSPAAYIARFYQFALMIAGTLAFGMIIFGAIQYTVSAGNVSKQSDARDRIFQALWGVALLLGAYLILFTIDPGLVSLRNPDITNLIPTSPVQTSPVPTHTLAGYGLTSLGSPISGLSEQEKQNLEKMYSEKNYDSLVRERGALGRERDEIRFKLDVAPQRLKDIKDLTEADIQELNNLNNLMEKNLDKIQLIENELDKKQIPGKP